MSPSVRIIVFLACVLAAAAFAASVARAELVPEAGSPYPAGSSTFAVAVGDFNHDHRADLAAPAEGSDDVTVLLGRAGGGYEEAPGSPFSVGDRPADVVAADFNGDGRDDVAVANFGADADGDTVSVLLAQPDGGLSEEAGSPLHVGTAPTSVETEDFNHDGRPDLAVTAQTGGVVTILLRDAGGGFTEEDGSPVPAGSDPFETAIGDFNRDKRLDLAVTDQSSNQVTILLRQPGGGFAEAPESPLPAGTQPLGIVATDFDGDGVTDLAFASFQSDEVSVLLGHGDGRFTLEGGATIHTEDGPYGIDAADFTGDGRPDLAVSNQFDDEVAILVRRPSGGFTAPQRVPAGDGPVRLAARDLDQDGDADLAVAAFGSSQLLVFNNAPATPPPPPPPLNLVRPSIVQADGSEFVGGKPGPVPHTYHCLPGTWAGRDPGKPYQFSWQRLTPDNHFVSGYRAETVASGEYYRAAADSHADLLALSWRFQCTVEASNSGGTTTATSPLRDLDPVLDQPLHPKNPRYGNFRVRGIDVFQSVQPNAGARAFGFHPGVLAGEPSEAFGFDMAGGGTPTSYMRTYYGGALRPGAKPQRTTYDGVPIDDTQHAKAVVYLDMTDVGDIATFQSKQLEVTLLARADGEIIGKTPDKPLGDALTVPFSTPQVSKTPYVLAAERDDMRWSVQFNLPYTWLGEAVNGKQLDLEARVGFPSGFTLPRPHECDARGCSADNVFRLDNLPVRSLPQVHVRSVELREASDAWNTAPQTVMQQASRLFPGGGLLSVLSSGAFVNISAFTGLMAGSVACTPWKDTADPTRFCREGWIDGALNQWEFTSQGGIGKDSSYDVLMGIHDYDNEPGWTQRGKGSLTEPAPYVHPTFTTNNGNLGRPLTAAAHEYGHILGLPHAGLSPTCNSPGAEEWPDQTGRLQGTKFDWWSAPNTVDPAVDDNNGATLFDLMSYCAPEGNAWISARNWNHAFWTLEHVAKAKAAVATAARAGRRTDRVAIGVVGPGGARILRVLPLHRSMRVTAPAATTPVTLRALDAAGKPLGAVGIAPRGSSEGPAGAGNFVVPVPAGAAAVELVQDGAVLDRIQRSRSPRVRVLAPRKGLHVRGHGALLVRWRASDPDGGPLQATVNYSATGGRSWSTVFQGPSQGRVRIPARALAAGRRARIRVSISDGFDETRALSRRFRADGTPPQVRIVRPASGERPASGDRALLLGSAIDDTHRELRGRALTWFAGGRRIARGARAAVRLPPGTVQLRLVARDRTGRAGVARLRVQVQRPPLRLTRIAYPLRISRGARRLRISIAASERATLRARGRSFRVGVRARRIALPLPRRARTGMLLIPVRLVASGGRRLGGLVQVRRAEP